jgi:hypothetical protein
MADIYNPAWDYTEEHFDEMPPTKANDARAEQAAHKSQVARKRLIEVSIPVVLVAVMVGGYTRRSTRKSPIPMRQQWPARTIRPRRPARRTNRALAVPTRLLCCQGG